MKKYRREIDGLRALALLPVVFSHAGFKWFKGTYIMIDLFFVVSGYLITSLIAKELTSGTFSIVRFYERRARRLLPALYVMMAAILPLVWFWFVPSNLVSFCKSLMAVPVFISNFLFWSEAGYFHPDSKFKPLLQTWSLSVEEQFYLLFPWLFVWLWPKGKKKVAAFFILLSILSFGCVAWGLNHDREANWYLLPGRIWEFAVGVIIALLPERSGEDRRQRIIAETASLFGMMILLISVFYFHDPSHLSKVYNPLPILGAALVIRFADSETLVGKMLGISPLVGIGLLSYGVFVWHQPLFAIARQYALKPIEPYIYMILILISFVLAYLSYRCIENPFRNLNFLKRKTFFVICGLFSLTFIGLGYFGFVKKGFPQRFEINEYRLFSKGSWTLPLKTSFYVGSRIPVSQFVQTWKNLPSEEPSLKTIPVAIYGNSFSGDIARALRRNGRLPLHIGGAYCNDLPDRDPDFCKALFDAFISKVKDDPFYKYIAIAQRHNSDWEVRLSALREKVEFWKQFNKQLIIISDPPKFPFLKESLIRGVEPAIFLQAAEASIKKDVLDYLKSENVILVDSLALYRIITPTYDFKKGYKEPLSEDTLLFTDDAHFSAIGQKEFGNALLLNYPMFR